MTRPVEQAVPGPPSGVTRLTTGRTAPESTGRPQPEHLRAAGPRSTSDRWDTTRTTDELRDLQHYMATMPVIEQAKGMLMTYYGVDADTAFAVLRRWSQTTNTKLSSLSARLVEAASQPDADACGALRRYLGMTIRGSTLSDRRPAAGHDTDSSAEPGGSSR